MLREEGGWGKVGKLWLKGGCRGGGKERGEYGQTGDIHFTMTGWVGSREGGRGDVEGVHMALFLQRTYKEEKWDG